MRSICLIVLLLVHATPARGDASEPPARWTMFVPSVCEPFVERSAPNHPMYWDRRLSLAACVQDATIAHVESPFDVAPMLAELSRALVPAMLIWRDALEHAPPMTRVRAAYGVGSAAVALITRARSSLVAPATMSDRDASVRLQILRSRLEPLLTQTNKLAYSAFTVLDDIARELPEFELDPVHAAMVRSARMWLRVLEPPSDDRIKLVIGHDH